jgi:DNA transformation protein
MKVSDGYRDYVLGQLAGVTALMPRPMFGGIGLYSDFLFFGIIASDVLYFKVDDENRAAYVKRGMGPFMPFADNSKKKMTMSYYQVPVDVLEDAGALATWAKAAVAAAARAGAKAGKKRAAKASTRT